MEADVYVLSPKRAQLARCTGSRKETEKVRQILWRLLIVNAFQGIRLLGTPGLDQLGKPFHARLSFWMSPYGQEIGLLQRK